MNTHRCARIKELYTKLYKLNNLLRKVYKSEFHEEYDNTLKEIEIQKAYRDYELSLAE